MPTRQHAVFPARLEATPAIRQFVGRACAEAGLGDDDRFAFELAADEACTNIVEHGYSAGSAGEIGLEFETDGEIARLTLLDAGRSFDPADVPRPELGPALLERPVGGLGLHFIRTTMDEVLYRAEPNGNRLILTRKLQRRPPLQPGKE